MKEFNTLEKQLIEAGMVLVNLRDAIIKELEPFVLPILNWIIKINK
jgi:recombinational DNA repair ATPase RecF